MRPQNHKTQAAFHVSSGSAREGIRGRVLRTGHGAQGAGEPAGQGGGHCRYSWWLRRGTQRELSAEPPCRQPRLGPPQGPPRLGPSNAAEPGCGRGPRQRRPGLSLVAPGACAATGRAGAGPAQGWLGRWCWWGAGDGQGEAGHTAWRPGQQRGLGHPLGAGRPPGSPHALAR